MPSKVPASVLWGRVLLAGSEVKHEASADSRLSEVAESSEGRVRLRRDRRARYSESQGRNEAEEADGVVGGRVRTERREEGGTKGRRGTGKVTD